MKIIKRNGSEAEFDKNKIIRAISKANITVDESIRLTGKQIDRIAESVVLSCERLGRSPGVEEVQDMVEHQIMAHGAFEVAKNYITYRYTHDLIRQLKYHRREDTLSLIECNNEEAKQENSNKNPVGQHRPSATIWRARSRKRPDRPHSSPAGYRQGA